MWTNSSGVSMRVLGVFSEFSGVASGALFASCSERGASLFVLFRRSVHGGVPYAYRRATVYQENRKRQSAWFGRDYYRRERSWLELFARLSGRCALRGCLRVSQPGQTADHNRPAAAACDGSFL